MKFTEQKLEKAFTELLRQEGYPHHLGITITCKPDIVLIEDDFQKILLTQYAGHCWVKIQLHYEIGWYLLFLNFSTLFFKPHFSKIVKTSSIVFFGFFSLLTILLIAL